MGGMSRPGKRTVSEMGRRHGRQQKRRDRARIETLGRELERALEQERVTREALRIQRAEFQTLVREIEDVCPNSALLPPKELGFEPTGDRLRLPIRAPITRLMGPAIDFRKGTEYPTIETVDLYELRVAIERNLARFQRLVHVAFRGGPGSGRQEVGYAVSEQVWREIGVEGPHQVVTQILRMMLRELEESKRSVR